MNPKIKLDIEIYKEEINKLFPKQKLFPSSDSPLMIKRGQAYMRLIETNQAFHMTIDEAKLCPFKFEQMDINPQQACFAFLEAVSTLTKMNFDEVTKSYGFDIDAPPNTEYLLTLLWQIRPTHPLVVCHPLKTNQTLTTAEKNAIISTVFLQKKLGKTQVITVNPEYKKMIANAATGYYFVKFKLNELNKTVAIMTETAKSNPLLARVLQEYKKNLPVNENQMQIEH